MYNKHTTELYAAVIASVLVASVFAISLVQQQAAAQGNQTSSTGSNQTSGVAARTNQSGSNSTSNGTATGGSTSGTSDGPTY